jgi:UDP-N-acetylglucosamine 4-epimerase
MSKALVTGGCGFIGSNLANRLIEMGWNIDIVDDLSNGLIENLGNIDKRVVTADTLHLYEDQFEKDDKKETLIICGDFAHESILQRIYDGCYDFVFHLAANPRVEYSVQYPQVTTETNVLKTVELFKACADSDVERVIFSSSSSVYGNVAYLPTSESVVGIPESPYGLQKLQGEQYASLFTKLYDLDIVSLRYFNVYGPNQRGGSPYATAISAWCDAIYNDRPLRLDGDGTQTRDMVFVEDVVQANINAALTKSNVAGNSYNIGSNSSISNNEILEKLSDHFDDIEIMNAPWRPGDVMHTLADITAAHQDLDYEPEFSFSEGLERTLSWWDDTYESDDDEDSTHE